MSWMLICAFCDYYILVGDRGMRGDDMGAGVEAADLMKEHVKEVHDKSWQDYLNEKSKSSDNEGANQ